MNSWDGRAGACPGLAECGPDGRGAVAGELSHALERLRGLSRAAATASTHERCASALRDVLGEARHALALTASLAGGGEPEPEAHSGPAPSYAPVSAVTSSEWVLRSVVHDLKNMLLVIQNCAEGMKQGSGAGNVAREAGVVQDAVAHATRLVAKLLPPGTASVRPRGLELSECVLQFTGVIRSLVGERVTVVTRLAPVVVSCEQTAIARVLTNLATNARDAMPDGGTLTLTTTEVVTSPPWGDAAPPRPFARLSVTDTGSGMDVRTSEQAFERFFTTKPPGRGSGVGLATVREIVQGVGGFVQMDSRLGDGTTVSIHLPCVAMPA